MKDTNKFRIYVPPIIGNVYEKRELQELMIGFVECGCVLTNNPNEYDYVILDFRHFLDRTFTVNDPTRTIIIDIADDCNHLSILSKNCLLYFKRSCVNKESYSLINYDIPIRPFPLYVKKCYLDYITANDTTENRSIDVCCTHEDVKKRGIYNWNVYRGNLVNSLENFAACHSDIVCHIKYDCPNVGDARSGINISYFKTMCNSKIVVTCNPDNYEGDYRLWEALSSGALVFCDKLVTPIKQPLIDRTHIVYYDRNNFSELNHLIQYYLENDLERMKIAECGYEYAINNHTYKHRTQYVLNTIASLSR